MAKYLVVVGMTLSLSEGSLGASYMQVCYTGTHGHSGTLDVSRPRLESKLRYSKARKMDAISKESCSTEGHLGTGGYVCLPTASWAGLLDWAPEWYVLLVFLVSARHSELGDLWKMKLTMSKGSTRT